MPITEFLVECDRVAIAFNDSKMGKMRNAVGVYSIDGKLDFAITFYSTSVISLYFDEWQDTLIVYVPREKCYFLFDWSGELIQVQSYAERGYLKKHNEHIDKNGNEYYLNKANTLLRKNTTGEVEIFFKTEHEKDKLINPYLWVFIIIIIAGLIYEYLNKISNQHFTNFYR